jgi:hypothetical protein
MAETKPMSLRLPAEHVEWLDRFAPELQTSKTQLITAGLDLVGAVLDGAADELVNDITVLRDRCGDAVIKIHVTENEDGYPRANLLVDDKPVDYVRARPFLNREEGEVVIFLDVERPSRRPDFVRLGNRVLMVTQTRLGFGHIKPWPAGHPTVLELDLAAPEIEQLIEDAKQEEVVLKAEPGKTTLPA